MSASTRTTLPYAKCGAARSNRVVWLLVAIVCTGATAAQCESVRFCLIWPESWVQLLRAGPWSSRHDELLALGCRWHLCDDAPIKAGFAALYALSALAAWLNWAGKRQLYSWAFGLAVAGATAAVSLDLLFYHLLVAESPKIGLITADGRVLGGFDCSWDVTVVLDAILCIWPAILVAVVGLVAPAVPVALGQRGQ